MLVKKWILTKKFVGEPKEEDLQLVEEELSDELKDNEVLLEAIYLSVDPYMRLFSDSLNAPCVMIGEQVSRVIKSNNEKFPVGTYALCKSGWSSHYKSNGNDLEQVVFDLGDTSPSYCLGTLGMPGATAYIGLRLLEAKQGEVFVVNGAAGAVGSVIGQLAKIKGCKVIGFVGSDDKLAWCKDELGFDHVFNYKKIHFSEALKQAAPDGVDMFFDNVGGEFYHTIINKHMKRLGRVVVCGSISNYNDAHEKLYPATNRSILSKELRIQGIMVYTYKNEFQNAFLEMQEYIKDGRLKVQETVYEGFDKMRDAFFGLFKGENTGKAVVKA